MTNREVVEALLEMSPADLKEVFSLLAVRFAEKAEKIYDANPEENGLLAQPYAEISDKAESISGVFDEVVDDAGLPFEEVVDLPGPTTITAASQMNGFGPWRGR